MTQPPDGNVTPRSPTASLMRLLAWSFGLAIALSIPFLIWGTQFTAWFTGDAAIRWVRDLGPLGGIGVIGLLIADLLLPIPATAVMSAAGYVYGTLVGGLLSACGSFLSGMLGYALCRQFGRRAAARIAGPDDLARGEALFARHGAWLVALSRGLPLLPEVVSCLAGITRMPFGKFTISLACGSIPMSFIYAAIGHGGQYNAGLALALSMAVPAALWAAVQIWLMRSKR